MKVIYPAEIHNDADGLWLKFVDFACFTEGDSMISLMDNASEALECYVLGELEDGKALPIPSKLNDFVNSKDTFYTLVSCDVDLAKNYRSVKKTLTIPEWLNKIAISRNVNFSSVLQKALLKEFGMVE